LSLFKNLLLFLLGAVCYPVIEILWRGHTHISMAITGGGAFTALYRFYKNHRAQRLVARCVCGSFIITLFELVSGLLVNRVLMLNVWDYSKRKFNFKGQICLLYSFLWALLCIPVSAICRLISRRKKS
jgi:uncharacterized membrane protein